MNDALGRILFPHVHSRLRRKKVRFMFISVGVGLGASLILGAILYLMNGSIPNSRPEYPPGVTPPAPKAVR